MKTLTCPSCNKQIGAVEDNCKCKWQDYIDWSKISKQDIIDLKRTADIALKEKE